MPPGIILKPFCNKAITNSGVLVRMTELSQAFCRNSSGKVARPLVNFSHNPKNSSSENGGLPILMPNVFSWAIKTTNKKPSGLSMDTKISSGRKPSLRSASWTAQASKISLGNAFIVLCFVKSSLPVFSETQHCLTHPPPNQRSLRRYYKYVSRTPAFATIFHKTDTNYLVEWPEGV